MERQTPDCRAKSIPNSALPLRRTNIAQKLYKNMYKRSKFRFIKPAPVKQIYASIPLTPLQQLIACSEDFIVVSGNRGSATIFPLTDYADNTATFKCHQRSITSLETSPWDSSRFCSTGSDGILKFWKYSSPESDPETLATVTGHKSGLTSCSFHPSTLNIMALTGNQIVAVCDLEKAEFSTQLLWDSKKNATGNLCWHPDGSSALICRMLNEICTPNSFSGKTKHVTHADLRILPDFSDIELAINPTHVHYVAEHVAMIHGTNQRKQCEIFLFDDRKFNSPLCFEKTQSVGNQLIEFDYATGVVFRTVRGGQNMNVYDVSSCEKFEKINKFNFSNRLNAFCVFPKKVNKIQKCEVFRFLHCGPSKIETVNYYVKKRNLGFHPELFPDAPSSVPSCTAEEYFAGENKLPNTESLEKYIENKSISAQTSASEMSVSEKEKEEELLQYEISEKRKILNQKLQKSIFTHLSIAEAISGNSYWKAVRTKTSLGISHGRHMICNSNFVITQSKTETQSANLSIFPTGEHAKYQRIPTKYPFLSAHSAHLSAFECCPTNPYTLATASVNGNVKIWTLPRGGEIPKKFPGPDVEITTNGKVNCIKFHPLIEHMLFVATTNAANYDLSIYNTATGAEIAICRGVFGGAVNDIQVDYSGNSLVTSCKDGIIRCLNVRTLAVEHEFMPAENLRDFQVTYAGKHSDFVVSIGYAKNRKRGFSVWKVSGEKCVHSTEIDRSNSQLIPHYDEDIDVLLLASIGERSVRAYDMKFSGKSVDVEEVPPMTLSSEPHAICFAPKLQCDVRAVELGRFFVLYKDTVKPAVYTIPRRRKEYFQDDIFPPSRDLRSVCSLQEWENGFVLEGPKTVSLQPEGMIALSVAPEEELTERQKKHIRMKYSEENKDRDKKVTMVEHFQAFEHVVEAAPKTNKWDAKSLVTDEVADEEWDD